ncbi:MAG: hypothetical protein IJS69_00315, partial [Selenomonadaceae bacterium]|nr:hypothetical protein [Selenomonadaceae bacterium]
MIGFFIALVGAISTFFFLVLTYIFYKRSRSVNIFHRLRRHHLDEDAHGKKKEDIFRRGYKFIQRTAKHFDEWNLAKNLDFKLKQAGIPVFGGEFI